MEPIELSVLEAINKYGVISQRELSNHVGISLGMVNMLIHKFAKVGLVKIEHLSGKKIKYILTPEGFSVLSKKTIDYISRSYSAVLKIKTHMCDVIKNHYGDGETVLIYGAEDEIYEVLTEVLKDINYDYKVIETLEPSMKFVHWDEGMFDQGVFLFGG